ncbi:Coiled-coil-helix-coiled-coil-helix domain-containing protein 2 [Scheffersomyces spartinae]|uniref:Coiled-coil-helix-coiled-coil-helix domain-containing protein 2 n=1 Tax=Scheffersomyces spartinae TaxID=45513 RepID=A0A9P8AIP6_9ASCO|nr:Coiled-coil-helix-coiled-coil-helix domain-containing protein 2 [Scheffersomyces spartinae]KAG7193905.1 Coiled-coil-helix-coiled-coil-helix domain-containing protein 2 [Scheffersomyces spartinae]
MARQRRSAPVRTQTRSAHTAAAPASYSNAAQHPPAPAAHPQVQQKQPGMFAQMASTAAGVAVGSAVGHTIGAGITSMFGGSSAPAAPADQQVVSAAAPALQQFEQAKQCDADARNFTRCLEDNGGNMQICDYYLQQLKACQEASRQY